MGPVRKRQKRNVKRFHFANVRRRSSNELVPHVRVDIEAAKAVKWNTVLATTIPARAYNALQCVSWRAQSQNVVAQLGKFSWSSLPPSNAVTGAARGSIAAL